MREGGGERAAHGLAVMLLVVLLVVVVAPLLVVVIGSVADTSVLGLTSESWQPDASAWSWFSYVLELYGEHLARSVWFAIAVVMGAFIIGFPAAYALARRTDAWSATVRVLLDAPLAVPGLTVGIGLLLAYPWGRASGATLAAGHLLYALPFFVRAATNALSAGSLAELEEAAAAAGASIAQRFRRIVLPLARPGLLAGALMAFTTLWRSRMSARVEIRSLSCSFDGQPALREVGFTLEPGTRTTLVGASGSGKTTLLRCLAGLLTPDSGQVLFDGRDVTQLPAEARGVGLVFQSYALFPHLSVADNIGFGLEVRGIKAAERRKRVVDLAEQLGVAQLLDRKPQQISGGERQRVALGRALAYRPVLLLLDEPLAALDPNLAESVREVLLKAIEIERTTVLLVTHDRADALRMGQRVALLRAGQLEQIGTPRELYRTPHTEYAAHFFGPGLFWDGIATQGNGASLLETPFGRVLLPSGAAGPVRLLLRPEALRLSDQEGAAAVVGRVIYEGSRCRITFAASGLNAQLDAPPDKEFAVGDSIRVGVDPELLVVLPMSQVPCGPEAHRGTSANERSESSVLV